MWPEDLQLHMASTDDPGDDMAAACDRGGRGWLLIGAPEDQTDQPGVVRGGAVYRASTTPRRTILERIPFDQTGNNNDTNGFQLDEKSGQWLGATVRSAGVNGSVLACAPRYVWYTATRNKREPVGTCFLSTAGFDDFMEVCPCRNNYETGHNKHGFCQFGFGADVSDDNTWLFIGAVGSWYWQGRMFAYGQDAATVATREGDLSDDDSYLGYSVITGEFTGDDKPDIAVGMPRGSNLTGRVVLYTAALVNLHNITGTQLGAYFGYSLAVADVDGDKLDDIIIGAPMFSDEENSANWEIGRVYIAYQNKKVSRNLLISRPVHRLLTTRRCVTPPLRIVVDTLGPQCSSFEADPPTALAQREAQEGRRPRPDKRWMRNTLRFSLPPAGSSLESNWLVLTVVVILPRLIQSVFEKLQSGERFWFSVGWHPEATTLGTLDGFFVDVFEGRRLWSWMSSKDGDCVRGCLRRTATVFVDVFEGRRL
ncbi:unnamed protein product, partial [Cyprideis torosa]